MRSRFFFGVAGLLAGLAAGTVFGSETGGTERAAAGVITTVAGGSVGDGRPGRDAALLGPAGIFVDEAGNLFIADRFHHRIRKMDVETGMITTVAGSAIKGYWGDGGPATVAGLSEPVRVFADGAGNLFVVERNSHRVRKVDGKTGMISTVVGDGFRAADGLGRFFGDGGVATAASLSWPEGIFVDSAGNLFIADSGNHRVRRVDGKTGVISTVAGNAAFGYAGDDRPATATSLWAPRGVWVDEAGNLLIADTGNDRVRRVDGKTGMISTVAGDGFRDEIGRGRFFGDGGPAASASLYGPEDVFVDRDGDLLIADVANARIRKVSRATGVISTVAGNGTLRFSGDGGLATGASLGPRSVFVDGSGHLLISDVYNHRVRRVDGSTGEISTIAGNGGVGSVGDGGLAQDGTLNRAGGVFVIAGGDVLIADASNHRVRRVDGRTGVITTVAGDGFKDEFGRGRFYGDGGPATDAGLYRPGGVFADGAGHLFIADTENHRVRRVDAGTGAISTVAGNGVKGYGGDGGPASAAGLNHPLGVFVDGAGDLFIVDTGNHRVRRVDGVTGMISTVAGDGFSDGSGRGGLSGDGGPATAASMNAPEAVFVDGAGNLWIADTGNYRVRKVDGATGMISTVAGDGFSDPFGRGRFYGDGGPATRGSLYWPNGVFVDGAGNLLIADAANHRVRKVDGAMGMISTVAGDGFQDQLGLGRYWGDGGPAIFASLNLPMGLFVDGAGDVFVADRLNDRVRKVGGVAAPTGLVIGVGPGGVTGRRRFFDGDGNPVHIVKLNGATPLVQDFEDFLSFASAFGFRKGEARYETQADVNEDQVVNFQDFLLFAQTYGRVAAGPAGKPAFLPGAP